MKVYNWQLNREMDYKYQEIHPQKQVTWVFDTNKCIACQTCTMACKNAWTSGKGQEYMFWNNVESKPWGFYPLGWDVKLLEKLGPQHGTATNMLERPSLKEHSTGRKYWDMRLMKKITRTRTWARMK